MQVLIIISLIEFFIIIFMVPALFRALRENMLLEKENEKLIKESVRVKYDAPARAVSETIDKSKDRINEIKTLPVDNLSAAADIFDCLNRR